MSVYKCSLGCKKEASDVKLNRNFGNPCTEFSKNRSQSRSTVTCKLRESLLSKGGLKLFIFAHYSQTTIDIYRPRPPNFMMHKFFFLSLITHTSNIEKLHEIYTFFTSVKFVMHLSMSICPSVHMCCIRSLRIANEAKLRIFSLSVFRSSLLIIHFYALLLFYKNEKISHARPSLYSIIINFFPLFNLL